MARSKSSAPSKSASAKKRKALAAKPKAQLEDDVCQKIIEQAGDSVFLFDNSGVILLANPHAEKLLGYKRGGLLGKTLWGVFILPHKCNIPPDLAIITTGKLPRAICEQRHANGTRLLPTDLRMRRLDATRVMGIARCLCKDALLIESTKQQAAYYKGLFENNTSGALVFDNKIRITAVNRALLQMLRYRRSELIGQHAITLFDSESEEQARELFGRMLGGDRKFNTNIGGGAKLALRRKDGKVLQTQASMTMIGDETVLFREGTAIFTDITQEIRYRRERDRQAKFNEDLLADTAAIIIVLDAEGRVVRLNPAAEKLGGYPAREVLGKPFWELGIIVPQQIASIRALFTEVITGLRPIGATMTIITRQGAMRTIEVSSSAILGDNDVVQHIITTGYDVTERSRLEAELVRVAEQEQMRIGHDLHDGVGQVLTGALSLSEALEYRLQGNERAEGARVRQLIKDAIDQVRLLSRGLSPAAIKNRSLAQALTLIAESFRSPKLIFECHIECEPTFCDPGVETHLYRIAQEAVNNAVRHAQPRHILLKLTPDSEGFARLEVENDGLAFDHRKALKAQGIGVRVMQHRASLIDAQLLIKKGRSGGTHLSVRFPCTFSSRQLERDEFHSQE